MTIEQMRKVHTARPFREFAIHLADGREVRVDHPEFLMFSPSGRTIVVADTDDTFDIIDLLLVTDLEVRPTPRTAGRSRRDS